ncbi:hypothetical protein JYB87_10160 [Shewanella avicenniae]|uniref:Uncharacterized protein n=1 Tax=Shewanella avicenniae TaxID=2814294 RepID=A0ABX7QL13_9GAMM|nr:hypothetical protein [Shewanella avicenniae]QSX32148.1 hypothetical protein JYB87_10160 [Shewanella avicenniae]
MARTDGEQVKWLFTSAMEKRLPDVSMKEVAVLMPREKIKKNYNLSVSYLLGSGTYNIFYKVVYLGCSVLSKPREWSELGIIGTPKTYAAFKNYEGVDY